MKLSYLLTGLSIAISLNACASKAATTETATHADVNTVLVVYFSATGTTKAVAEKIQKATDGDIFEIVPQKAYTATDLDYNTDCRANTEQQDESARPAISNNVNNISQYDVVFIGYPIWWGIAPRVVQSFLESYDFAGKTIVPFCTSGGSGIGRSYDQLRQSAPDAKWLEGRRLYSSDSQSVITEWTNNILKK